MAANKNTSTGATTTIPIPATDAPKVHKGVHYVRREHNEDLGFIGHFAEGAAYLLWCCKHPILAFGNSAGFMGIGLVGFAIIMLILGALFGGNSNSGNAIVDIPTNVGGALNEAGKAPVDNIRKNRQQGSSNFGNGLQPPANEQPPVQGQ
jgi:hypothetical protein